MRVILHPCSLEVYQEIAIWLPLHPHKVHPHYFCTQVLLISECHKANLVPEKILMQYLERTCVSDM